MSASALQVSGRECSQRLLVIMLKIWPKLKKSHQKSYCQGQKLSIWFASMSIPNYLV